VLITVLSVTIVLWPEAGMVGAILVWGIIAAWSLPPNLSLGVPLATLLLIPADHIAGLDGPREGFFVLAAAIVLATASALRGRQLRDRGLDWDILLLVGVLFSATLLHAGYGELRGLLYWAAGALFLYWLRAEESKTMRPEHQVAMAIGAAGAISGALAFVEYLRGADLQGLLPGYVPHTLEFSYSTGLRASALSGHPLRLGTLTMLSSLIALGWLTDDRPQTERRLGSYVLLTLSLAGLVLSGARGAWLGFVLGAVAISVSKLGTVTFRRFGLVLANLVAAVLLLWVSGIWSFVYERIFGAAFHAGSLDQRLQALQGIPAFWSHIPLFGVGFGGAADVAARIGMKLPNLENEYLRFFLTAGLVGPVALLVVGIRRFLSNLRRAPSVARTISIGTTIGLFVNVGTYNAFSWSVAPLLFVAISILALRPHGARDEALLVVGGVHAGGGM
jgi:hypothetical protein